MIELGKRYKLKHDKMGLDGLMLKGSEFTATAREVGDHWLNEWTRTGDITCVEQESKKEEAAPAPKEAAPAEVATAKEETDEKPKEEPVKVVDIDPRRKKK